MRARTGVRAPERLAYQRAGRTTVCGRKRPRQAIRARRAGVSGRRIGRNRLRQAQARGLRVHDRRNLQRGLAGWGFVVHHAYPWCLLPQPAVRLGSLIRHGAEHVQAALCRPRQQAFPIHPIRQLQGPWHPLGSSELRHRQAQALGQCLEAAADHGIVQTPFQSGEKADFGGEGQRRRACEPWLCQQHRIELRLEAGSKGEGEGHCGDGRANGIQPEQNPPLPCFRGPHGFRCASNTPDAGGPVPSAGLGHVRSGYPGGTVRGRPRGPR
jgi:hypothetical protein